MSVSAPLLEVANLTLRRGSTTLLRAVNWAVRPGEHWVIMGPNGCGKTSLLRSLFGLLTPSSGDLHLLGETYGETDWRDLRCHLGLVSSALHAHVPPGETALDTVISGRYDQLDLWTRPTAADLRAAQALLRRFRLGALADRPWLVLSQGERQRVLIARALAAQPKILVLDEPCAGLDPVARADFLTLIQSMTQSPRGPSLVLVTHHVEEITTGFTDALILARGRTVARGPLRSTLNSVHLSAAFGRPVNLRRTPSGWQLTLPAAGKIVR
jgi:iron complex transport system ATP-binding protein